MEGWGTGYMVHIKIQLVLIGVGPEGVVARFIGLKRDFRVKKMRERVSWI